MKLSVAIVCLIFAPICFAQVAEIQAGASSFMGTGGGVLLYGPNSETLLTGGVLDGHVVYGGSEHFMWRKWDVVVGDKQFGMTSGTLSLAVPVRGVSAKLETKKQSIELVSGFIGQVYSAPYFFGIRQANLGAGIAYHRALTDHWSVSSIDAFGKQTTALEELRYHLQHWDIKERAGILQDTKLIDGSAGFTSLHFSILADRSTYVLPTSQVLDTNFQRTDVNSISTTSGYGFVSASASYLDSTAAQGRTAGVSTNFSWLTARADVFESDSRQGQKQKMVFGTITERGLHWSLSQYLSKPDNGGLSVNFGGGLTYNRFAVSVGYSTLFFPLLNQPFQRVLSINLNIHIRALSVTAATIVQPNAKSEWTVYGDQFADTHLHVPTLGDGDAIGRKLTQTGHGGKFVFTGVVVDDKNNPVEGAALIVGKDQVYTNTQGEWSVHEKKSIEVLKVDTENFMTGEWVVVQAPSIIKSGDQIHVTVKRK